MACSQEVIDSGSHWKSWGLEASPSHDKVTLALPSIQGEIGEVEKKKLVSAQPRTSKQVLALSTEAVERLVPNKQGRQRGGGGMPASLQDKTQFNRVKIQPEK